MAPPGGPTTNSGTKGVGGAVASRSKPIPSAPSFHPGDHVRIIDPKGTLKKHEALVGTVAQVVEALENGDGSVAYKVKAHDGRLLELSKTHLHEVVSEDEEAEEDAMMAVEDEGRWHGAANKPRNGLSALDALAEAGSQVDRQHRRDQARASSKLSSFKRGGSSGKSKVYEEEEEEEAEEEEDDEEDDRDAMDASAAVLWLTKGQTKPRKKSMITGHSMHDESHAAAGGKGDFVEAKRPKSRGDRPPRPPVSEAMEEEEEEDGEGTDTGPLRPDEETRSQLSDHPSEANDVGAAGKEGRPSPALSTQFGKAPPVGKLGRKKGRGRRLSKPEDQASERMSQDGEVEGQDGDAEVDGEGEMEIVPKMNEKERQQKREQYIEYVKKHVERYLERFKDRPNLSFWLAEIQEVAKSDDEREDEEEYRDLLEDDTCLWCNTERGRSNGYCWNVRCPASPLFVQYTPKKAVDPSTSELPAKKKRTEEDEEEGKEEKDKSLESSKMKEEGEVEADGSGSGSTEAKDADEKVVVKMEVDDAAGKIGDKVRSVKEEEEGGEGEGKEKGKVVLNGVHSHATDAAAKVVYDPSVPCLFLPPATEEGDKTGAMYGELKFRHYPPTRPSDALFYSLHAPVKLLDQSRKRKRSGDVYSCDPLLCRYQVSEEARQASEAATTAAAAAAAAAASNASAASTSSLGGSSAGGSIAPGAGAGAPSRERPTPATTTAPLASQRPSQPVAKPMPVTTGPPPGPPAPARQPPVNKPRPGVPTSVPPMEKAGPMAQHPPPMRVSSGHPGMAPSQPVMPMMYPGGPGMGVYGYQFPNQPRGMAKPGAPSHPFRKPEGPTLMDMDPGIARRGPGVFPGGPTYFHHPYVPPGLATHPMYPGPQPDYGPPRAPPMLYAPPDMSQATRMPPQQPRKPSPPLTSGGSSGTKPGGSPILSGIPPSRSGGFGEGERYYGNAPPSASTPRNDAGSAGGDGPSPASSGGNGNSGSSGAPFKSASSTSSAKPSEPGGASRISSAPAKPSPAPSGVDTSTRPAPPPTSTTIRPPPSSLPGSGYPMEEEAGGVRKAELMGTARSIMPLPRPAPPPSRGQDAPEHNVIDVRRPPINGPPQRL